LLRGLGEDVLLERDSHLMEALLTCKSHLSGVGLLSIWGLLAVRGLLRLLILSIWSTKLRRSAVRWLLLSVLRGTRLAWRGLLTIIWLLTRLRWLSIRSIGWRLLLVLTKIIGLGLLSRWRRLVLAGSRRLTLRRTVIVVGLLLVRRLSRLVRRCASSSQRRRTRCRSTNRRLTVIWRLRAHDRCELRRYYAVDLAYRWGQGRYRKD
jgi:hypothetical protein